jgi:DNA-binding GntR family transcriptional regulator
VVKPLYQEIADDLREQINDGRLGPGAKLPTQEQLAEKWLVPRGKKKESRGSIRRALDELVYEGLVVSRRPLGMFVRDRRRILIRPQEEFGRQFSPVADYYMGTVREQGGEPSQTIDAARVYPPAIVAEKLRTSGEVVAVRRRVRSVDGERYDLNDSYYPLTVVDGTEAINPDDVPRGINRVLDEHGYRQTVMTDEYVWRMPTRDEADRLEIPPGTPVLEQVVTGYVGETTDAQAVRCVVSIYPGDRYRLSYERRRSE